MRLLNLATILRNTGLTVIEEPGWQKRGSDSFGPLVGMTIHETRGSKTSSVAGEINVLINGRPGLDGPISQLFLSRVGTWYTIASGTCHHNKVGWAGPNKGFGNDNLLGIEAQHALDEPWTAKQYDSYVKGTAALAEALSISVNRIAGHFEHQPGDKSDPAFNMDTFRQRVALAMREQDDDMPTVDEVWAKEFAEYYDENGNLLRDKITVAHALFLTSKHAAMAHVASDKALEVAEKNEATLQRIEALLSTPTPTEG